MPESPNESAEYRRLRAQLLDAEIELKEGRERVAELRRKLPIDTPVNEYCFVEGPLDLTSRDETREKKGLAELFANPHVPLVLMQFMFGGAQEKPCPMCTMWADGYDALAPHIRQRANLAVLVAGEVEPFRAYARERGWSRLRILSASESSVKRDLGFEDADGAQHPGVSVFVQRDGTLLHSVSVCALMADEEFRGMDLLCPTWHFFDLLPDGRGDWFPSTRYEP